MYEKKISYIPYKALYLQKFIFIIFSLKEFAYLRNGNY